MKITSRIDENDGREVFTMEPAAEGEEGWEMEQRFLKSLALQLLDLARTKLECEE